jgi:Holliday junction resolvase
LRRYGYGVDANEDEIVRVLEAAGALVQRLGGVGDGCPDLLVGWRSRLFLLEVKDGSKKPSEQKLTPPQETFHELWRGYPVAIVRDPAEALRAIGAVVTEVRRW